MATEIQLCEMSISSYTERFGKYGKILKNAFSIGPSKASMSNGKIIESQDVQQSNQSKETTQTSTDSQQSEQNTEQSTTNDSYIRVSTFSILEAYTKMSLVYEADDDQNTKEQPSENRGQSTDSDDEAKHQETFKEGQTYTFKLEIPDEGFTEWTVLFDERADVEAAKTAIRAKQFKTAMQTASKGLESDGLVPIKARTCIYKITDFKKTPAPNFIGHCRYAFDSGSDEDTSEDNLTVCLAVAPINAETNKPDSKTVIQAIYNVTGDITGGTIGKLGTALNKKIRDAADGKSSKYYDKDSDEKDSEKSLSEELSKYLHNAFRCVGDHTMYKNYLTIRKFLSKQIAAKNIEFLTYKIGDRNVDSLVKKFPLGQLVYF